MGTEAGVKLDTGKPRLDLVMPELICGVGEVLTFGARKYTPGGWKTVPQANERYLSACLRHLTAHMSGETNDEESGLSHLKHAATNLGFLLHFAENPQETK